MKESYSLSTATLLAVVMVVWFAGQASAGAFTLDNPSAMLLQQISVSPGDTGLLFMVTDDPAVYGGPMQGTVGYYGWLWDHGDADTLATIQIGAAGTAALSAINAAGTFTSYKLFVANDNDDPWAVQLYMDAGGTSYATGFTALTDGTSSVVTLNFGAPVDFSTVTDLGFAIRGDFSAGSPSNPDFFHVSVAPVPAPGALALVLFGLSVGLKWRKHVSCL